jgi:hypothetical protein
MENDIKPFRTHVERETILTNERPITTNSREPNMTRIILLRRNTAYALEPHTAIGTRVGKIKKEVIVARVGHGGNKTHW